jgi:hypothetical protein
MHHSIGDRECAEGSAGESYGCGVVRRSWAKSHAPKPAGVFHDARRFACASAASVWGSQHILSQGTCTPTVFCPLGWTVACPTRPGQHVRPAAPSSAPDRRQRLVPVPPLAGGCCVRGGLLHRGEAARGLRTLQHAAVATSLTPSRGHLHRGPSRYSRESGPSRRPPPGGR